MFAHLNIINLRNQNFFYWIQVTSNLNNKKYSNFKNRLCGCVYKVLSYLRICHLLQVTSVCTPQHSAGQLSLGQYCVAKVSLVFLRNHWNVHLTKRKNKKKKTLKTFAGENHSNSWTPYFYPNISTNFVKNT